MTWKCPACGTNENSSDLLRCSCGYEDSGDNPKEIKTIQNESTEFPRLEDITQCPECNSTNIEKFNTYKRGKLLLALAALYLIITVATNSLGYSWFGFAILFIGGIRAIIKNRNIIVCKDCMYSNNNKWLKRMKDA